MLFLSCRLLFFALLVSFSTSTNLSADKVTITCKHYPVTFESDGNNDFICLCSSVNAALDFLTSIGLKANDRITVRLVDHISSNIDHTLIGSYNPTTREVSLLTYVKAIELVETNKLTPVIPMSEELWCSYAAHELAHAISCEYLSPDIKTHTAGEYISAVTQLSVLSARTRGEILDRYADIEAYHSSSEMSELYFFMDPNKFAVKCYKHFISLENRKDFIETLLREGNGYW